MSRNLISKFGGIAVGAAFAVAASAAVAAVSEQEAARLGADLTPMGAEKAGNASGSIPAWTGGLRGIPEGGGIDADGFRKDPFAADKPLFTITADTAAKYDGQLSEGVKAFFKKYPQTWRMDVYPSRRTHAAPDWVYANTKANATRAKLVDDGNSVSGAIAGIPFPAPKNGAEAIWNHLLRWQGQTVDAHTVAPTRFPNGTTSVGGQKNWDQYPYYVSRDKETDTFYQVILSFDAPLRRKGEVLMVVEYLNQVANPREAWQYIPGQRRVRRGPTIAYDTPVSGQAGQVTFDDVYLFNGALDRYDWKLLGKQEKLIVYNNYRSNQKFEDSTALLSVGHPNPDYLRWELHRVWVVEAELKGDKRHIYGKRRFYLDEDSWVAALSDAYDGRGNLWRVGIAPLMNHYDLPGTVQRTYFHGDLLSGVSTANILDVEGVKYHEQTRPETFYTPANVRALSLH
ncbi:MAG: DUF1329 domain-containing protein [Rhodospirillales bacterium]|nr:DUF1329 domain-containing protein [Rhodospirillales bacterium]